jgi:hypothetical protein
MSSTALIGQLKSTLETLARGPVDQLLYVRRLGTGMDELALEFDDVAPARLKLLAEGSITLDQSDAIAAVDRQLDRMTRAGPVRWTEQAVLEGEDWEELRRVARNALAAL